MHNLWKEIEEYAGTKVAIIRRFTKEITRARRSLSGKDISIIYIARFKTPSLNPTNKPKQAGDGRLTIDMWLSELSCKIQKARLMQERNH